MMIRAANLPFPSGRLFALPNHHPGVLRICLVPVAYFRRMERGPIVTSNNGASPQTQR